MNNFIISFLTFGEGYHNYHHAYANDYRNGVRWYQFDPAKWLIWTLSKFGFAWNLRRVDPLTIKKKMVLEGKDDLMKSVKDLWYVRREDVEARIQECSDKMLEKITRFNELKGRYQKLRKERSEGWRELKGELKWLRKSIKRDWKHWSRLYRDISHLRPISV